MGLFGGKKKSYEEQMLELQQRRDAVVAMHEKREKMRALQRDIHQAQMAEFQNTPLGKISNYALVKVHNYAKAYINRPAPKTKKLPEKQMKQQHKTMNDLIWNS